MVIAIKTEGQDGFGHQLHGLFTTLILHGVNNYYFDGNQYNSNNFKFEHIDENQSNNIKDYLVESIQQFIDEYQLQPKIYNKYIRSVEIYKIPENSEIDTIYIIDNVFDLTRIPGITQLQLKQCHDNINLMKRFFINKYLPPKRLCDKNIVIHVRGGDALNHLGTLIRDNNYKLCMLLEKLNFKYPDHTYYIHSDDNVDFITQKLESLGKNYTVYDKNTHVLQVLSDFLYSSIFVGGVSSLSYVSQILGNQELIISPDNFNCVDIKNTIYISDFK